MVLLAIAVKELAGFSRLKRMDALHRAATQALAGEDLTAARDVVARLDRFYAGRAELEWGRARIKERSTEQFEAETLLGLARGGTDGAD